MGRCLGCDYPPNVRRHALPQQRSCYGVLCLEAALRQLQRGFPRRMMPLPGHDLGVWAGMGHRMHATLTPRYTYPQAWNPTDVSKSLAWQNLPGHP